MGEMFFLFWFYESKVVLNSSRARLIVRIEEVAMKGIDKMGSHFSKDFQIC